MNGYSTSITNIEQNVEPVELPDWSSFIFAKGEELPLLDEETFASQDVITANGYYYSEDNIEISGTTFDGNVIIVSEGDITYNVGELSGMGKIILYSINGDITINGSEIMINGLLYAPNGRISFNTYDTTVNGLIVGNKFSYSGSILNATFDSSLLELINLIPEVANTPTQVPPATNTPTPEPTATNTPTPIPIEEYEYSEDDLFAEIYDYQEGMEITFVEDILGTVSGDLFESYLFELIPSNGEGSIYSYAGFEQVVDGSLGQIDSTLYMNGYYVVRVTAFALDGGFVTDEVVVLLTGNAKIGNYSISFLDITLPVNGIPLEVYRTYDSLGNVTSVEDALGNITTYGYDQYGRQISTTNAAGLVSIKSYDEYGRVITSVDYGGHETVYAYDYMDRVISAVTDGHQIEYSYDDYGNLILVTDEAGTIQYGYSYETGYLTSITNSNNQTIYYSYNSQGAITRISYEDYYIEYGYDVLGRIVSVTNSEGIATYSYDGIGNLIEENYPNGVTTTYSYDEAGVLTEKISTNSNGDVLSSYTYEIGLNNERLSVTELNRTVNYEYDNLNRLVREEVDSASYEEVTEYVYDANSNRIAKIHNGEVKSYTYNELNQLVTAGSSTYTWDNAGNLVAQSESGVIVASYEYDSYNRMISATISSVEGNLVQSYTYNYLGTRTSKTDDGVTTNYLIDYSGEYSQVLLESNSDENIFYTRGLELISQTTNSEVLYYLLDGSSSVRNLTDSNSVITDIYVYDAYGNMLDSAGSSSNSYGFQGEQRDETGLYYLRARYLDPDTGTFTSMDPYGGSVSDPISLHKFLFANSNPAKYSNLTEYFALDDIVLK